jgi:molybdopterin-guanine dinucleotide biosynthesis protein
MELNEQQKEGFDKIIEFLNGDKTSFNLSGYGGTGKTTLISFIINEIKTTMNRNIVICSPTHQANKIIKNSLKHKQEVKTIASLFKKLWNPAKRSYEFKLSKDDDLPYGSVLIIDECSMISNEDFEVIVTTCEKKEIKVIFMGDKMQIPPIGSKQISLSFTETDEKFLLTKLMRQNDDNPLVKLYSRIRSNPLERIHLETDINEEKNEGLSLSHSKDSFNHRLTKYFCSQEFKENKKFCRVLCYTNNKVEEYNKLVRKSLFPDSSNYEYQIGDLLKGYDQVAMQSKIQNGQDYLIVNSSDKVIDLFMLDLTGVKTTTKMGDFKRKVNKVQVSVKQVTVIEMNDDTNLEMYNDKFIIDIPLVDSINNLFFKNLSELSTLQGKVTDFKLKTELYKELSTIFKTTQLDDSIFLHEGTFVSLKKLKETNSAMFKQDDFGYCEFDDLLKKHKALVLKKNIDYGYASTVHKI